MKRNRKVLIVVLFCILFFLLDYGWPWLFRKTSDITSCKEFINNNLAVRNHFGSIKKIRFIGNRSQVGVEISSEKGKVVDGLFHFYVMGDQSNDWLRIKWKRTNYEFYVIRVYLRKGLIGIEELWPNITERSERFIIPSQIWDGIISLLMSLSCLWLYYALRNKIRWVTFIFGPVLVFDKSREFSLCVCTIAVATSFIKGILCFLGLTTIF